MPPSDNVLLDRAFNVLNEAVFVYNQNMEIRYFNTAAEEITGHKKEEVLGKKCVVIFDKSLCLNNCALCMTTKAGINERVRFESSFQRKDGRFRMGEFTAGGIRNDKDGSVEVLVSLVDITELTHLRQAVQDTEACHNLVGKSNRMKELYRSIRNVAEYDSTVLIHGESGTGKELVARAIHQESPRSGGRLVKVNCSAFSDSLLESELFGHVKGAFTGAVKDRQGRFEEADGGTLFLDEVGDLNARVQVKLLRVLQEREVERVGENVTRKVDIRVIAASHKDLLQEAKEGRFREDLYYRLNVIPISLPPLRERTEDIPPLVDHFLHQWNEKHSKKIKACQPPALGKLMDHHWPGNVRELENAIEHACVKCTKETLTLEDLPHYLLNEPGSLKQKPRRKRKWLTKKLVKQALKESDQNQTVAAEQLGVHRITLWRKMKEFQIT